MVSITGVSATGEIGAVNIWMEIDPSQTPGWSGISVSQSPGWTETTVSQSPGWTEIAA